MRIFAIFMTAILVGSGAQAATFSNAGTIDGTFIDGTPSGATGVDVFSFSVEWSGLTAPDFASFFFSSDGEFDLFLTSYSDLGSLAAVSAFTLDILDASFNFVSRVAGPTDDCSILVSDCFPVTNTSATSGAAGLVEIASEPSSINPLISGLSAGNYRLNFGESATPASGNAVFEVRTAITPVPLPASAALLLGGLMALGSFRRFSRNT